MMPRLLLFLLTAAPLAAQPFPAEDAAARLEPLLVPAAHLAATAALYHERTGRYPDTAFDLLGSQEAALTGLRRLRLARLDVRADADSLRLLYLLTPTAAEPSERGGAVAVTVTPDGVRAPFRITHRTDPDFEDRPLPVTAGARYRVRHVRGTLCVAPGFVRDRAEAGVLGRALPFLDPDEALTVTFSGANSGRDAGSVVLRPTNH